MTASDEYVQDLQVHERLMMRRLLGVNADLETARITAAVQRALARADASERETRQTAILRRSLSEVEER